MLLRNFFYYIRVEYIFLKSFNFFLLLFEFSSHLFVDWDHISDFDFSFGWQLQISHHFHDFWHCIVIWQERVFNIRPFLFFWLEEEFFSRKIILEFVDALLTKIKFILFFGYNLKHRLFQDQNLSLLFLWSFVLFWNNLIKMSVFFIKLK